MRDSRHFAREVACVANFAVERLDHLGMVAGVCQEMGLVEYFDGLDEREHARVSLGQAVLAMVLNGLGLKHRRLYLVPQFFTHKADAASQQIWSIQGTVSVNEAAVQAEVVRKAKFIVATTVPATKKGAEDLIRLYKAQNGVERGFALSPRSALPGLIRVRQESRAGDGHRVHHSPLSARLSLGGTSPPPAPGPDRRHGA